MSNAAPIVTIFGGSGFVGRYRHRLRAVDVDRSSGLDRGGIDGGIAQDLGEIGGGCRQRAALVETGQVEHLIHQLGHPRRLLLGSAHCVIELAGVLQTAHSVELGVPGDSGQGSPQFVRGVGHELAQARFRRCSGRVIGG